MLPSLRLFSRRAWIVLLHAGFGLLCLRFLFAAGATDGVALGTLSIPGFVLGWWHPGASLFALVLSLPLASGLERTVLQVPFSAPLTIASSIWLGLTARKLASARLAEGANSGNMGRSALGWTARIVDILAAIALVDLYLQIWRQSAGLDFWTRFWYQAHHGPADPAYFLTSGFLWLHGLFYFRALREHTPNAIFAPDHIKTVFFVTGVVLLFFHNVQWLCEFPARWIPGYESPYEDIATFGIIATCVLTVCLALIRRDSAHWLLVLVPGALLLAIAVGASWSRGSWLAGSVSVCVLALLRFPRRVALLVPLSLLGAIMILNLNAGKISPTMHVDRLLSLVRFESLENKSSGRFSLYGKAWVMTKERPWAGHGIGSFYRNAINYAKPGDPYAALHHFPHNILLHVAVEQGVPVALLLAGMVGWALWRGARSWLVSERLRAMRRAEGPVTVDPLALLLLGLTLALAAYLQANMTWDILLVHPTQPFFFWFLMAALWATIDRVTTSEVRRDI